MRRFNYNRQSNHPWLHVFSIILLTAGVTAAQADTGGNPTSKRQRKRPRTDVQPAQFESAHEASQQSESSVYHTPTGPFHQPVSLYPVEMGFRQHHSSTLQEGIQRGRAAVIQAQGQYEVNNAQANVIGQQARSLDLQNDLKQTQAVQVRKDIRHQAHVDNRKTREKSRAEGRMILAEKRDTVYRQAYQLSVGAFDPDTGAIDWPAALQVAKYQQHRESIEELFRIQVGYDEPHPGIAQEIERSIASLTKALRSDLGILPSDEYYGAHKFLRGLQQESDLLVSFS